MLRTLFLMGLLIARSGVGQDLSKDSLDKIDAAVSQAYQSAQAEFPCKLKGGGKPNMIRWEQVDRCLSRAADRVDWEALSAELKALQKRESSRAEGSFAAAVEASLSAHALAYTTVFAVKDDRALLPLTNSLLKYLPPDALLETPVMDKTGKQIGIFSGVYSYDHTGGLVAANTYRLALFQYTDLKGDTQVATNKLLLDSYGVPWKQAAAKGTFRLTVEKFLPGP